MLSICDFFTYVISEIETALISFMLSVVLILCENCIASLLIFGLFLPFFFIKRLHLPRFNVDHDFFFLSCRNIKITNYTFTLLSSLKNILLFSFILRYF